MINHQQYHFIPQQMMPINNGQLNQIPNNPHINNQATIAAYQQQQQLPHNNNNLMINNKVYSKIHHICVSFSKLYNSIYSD
jgi:hypothetical protein